MSSVVLVGLRTSSRFCTLRKLSTSSFQIFDRRAKRLQRARAARRENATVYDYSRDEVAFRLADRILDIKRTFEVAVDLGCGRGHLAQHLTSDAVSFLYQCDSCLDILKQAKPSPDVETMSLNVDEESLPFQENSINLFLSCLGLHWINDLRGTFSQVLRCLKPDGCFLGVTYGMDTLFELRVALQLAEMERLGGFYPHVSPFIDSARLGDLLQEAGFNLITLDVDELIIHYPSMFELMEDLRGMGESNAVVSRPLRLNRDVVSAAAAIYDERFGEPRENGKEGERCVPATFRLLYFIAWKPDPSQMKPLPRGSAEYSFKELSRLDELGASHVAKTNKGSSGDNKK
nr:unnamed protein product [Spirometra erinaceieuropaei]